MSQDAAADSVKAHLEENLSQSWQSDAASTIRDRFNALAPRFDQYREVVTAYAKFLDNTVANYDATEAGINSSASQFK